MDRIHNIAINNTDAAFVIVYFFPQREYKMCVKNSPMYILGLAYVFSTYPFIYTRTYNKGIVSECFNIYLIIIQLDLGKIIYTKIEEERRDGESSVSTVTLTTGILPLHSSPVNPTNTRLQHERSLRDQRWRIHLYYIFYD